jgi:hypothetical protein
MLKSILIILDTLSDNGQLTIRRKKKETQHTYIQKEFL